MASINGMVQLVVKDPSGRLSQIIMQNTEAQFERSTTPSEQLPMEEKNVVLYQDATLELWMKADSSATAAKASSVVNVPVTQYIATEGRNSKVLTNPAEIMLTADDFGVASSTALVAGAFQYLGKYKVPAGVAVRPGWGAADTLNAAKGRVYIKVATA